MSQALRLTTLSSGLNRDLDHSHLQGPTCSHPAHTAHTVSTMLVVDMGGLSRQLALSKSLLSEVLSMQVIVVLEVAPEFSFSPE